MISVSAKQNMSGPSLEHFYEGPDESHLELITDVVRVELARQRVLAHLQAAGLRPQAVLFSGYNPSAGKAHGGEFDMGDGTMQFYLGDETSMLPPVSNLDEESRGERWVTNPLSYALRPDHMLGVYDKESLRSRITDFDEEFGTYIVTAKPEDIEAARLLAIDPGQV